MTDYGNDIERYLRGEMTPAERHALEKQALSDPFLAEALEGLEYIRPQALQPDLSELQARLQKNLQQQVAASEMAERASAPSQSFSPPKQSQRLGLRMAAVVLLLITAGFVLWLTIGRPTTHEPLAVKSGSPASPPVKSEKETVPAGDVDSSEASSQISSGPSESVAQESLQSRSTNPIAFEKNDKADDQKEDTSFAVSQPLMAEAKPVEVQVTGESEEPKAEQAKAKEVVRDETPAPAVQITESRKKALSREDAGMNSGMIQGKVTSSDGSPLPGVNVVVKGTATGGITDAQGNYQVPSPEPNQYLVFSFLGMQSQEVQINNRKQIDVQLADDQMQLSEVVVTGSGIQQATIPDQLAQPTVGRSAYRKYLESTSVYPQEAREKRIEGRVVVEFTVEPNGTLTAFTVVQGIGAGCEEELIRLIKEGPAWTPSQVNGIPVAGRVRVQLRFQLPE